MHADPSGLTPGDYTAHVRIEAAEQASDFAILEVKLHVGATSVSIAMGATSELVLVPKGSG